MDTELKHRNYLTHQTMTSPCDVKVNNNKVYVLSDTDSPCLHVFSLTGEKIRSFITRGQDGNAQVSSCESFCLDKKQNILMADYTGGNIKVFSQEGALLHTWGTHRIETRGDNCSISAIKVRLDHKCVRACVMRIFSPRENTWRHGLSPITQDITCLSHTDFGVCEVVPVL